jgi:hypothetical protein
MGTKQPASPTAVVAAGRQCLPRHCRAPQRQGLIECYPRMSCESIITAASPTATRCLMACRRTAAIRRSIHRTTHRLPLAGAASMAKLGAQRCECVNARAQESLLPRRGERLPRFQRDEMSNPLLVDPGAGLMPTGTRCCGCLMLSIVARSRTGRFSPPGTRDHRFV